jgi:exodeoxyribonuclease VII large subunit
VEFEIREVAVQGNTAVSQVVRALRELDDRPEVDVIVIARGGGALEDLLPFNSEELVRAVAAAATPQDRALGHEADRPLLDDVADLRASTPTDAAKRIVPEVSEELAGVRQAREQLRRCIERLVDRESDRLAALHSRPVLASPEGLVTVRSEEIERLLRRSSTAVNSTVVRAGDRLEHLRTQVRALSPQKTLDRGYAVVELAGPHAASSGTGHAVVRRPADAPTGQPLAIRVAEGRFGATSTGSGSPGEKPETPDQHHPETGETTGPSRRRITAPPH